MALTDLDREVWLRTDEIEELIDALEHSARLAMSLCDDTKLWKWLILSLHCAVQGACVCALRGQDTAGIAMLDKGSAKKMLEWYHTGRRKKPPDPAPAEKLAPFPELLERVRDPKCLPPSYTLDVDRDALKDMKRLNQLRNKFIHFVPTGLSLELSGMPRIAGRCRDVIEHLAVRKPTFQHHLDESKLQRIKEALAKLEAGVGEWVRIVAR